MGLRRRGSYRSLRESQHFLDSCFLCHKRLTPNSDIFMYRGDTAFCSEEHRGEQMEMDEAKERSLKTITMKASSREERKSTKSTSRGVTVLVG